MEITLDYLKNIHDYHEKAFDNLEDKKIVINVDDKSIEDIGQEIYEFIYKL